MQTKCRMDFPNAYQNCVIECLLDGIMLTLMHTNHTMPVSVKTTLLLGEPLHDNSAAGAALQPLVWCSGRK